MQNVYQMLPVLTKLVEINVNRVVSCADRYVATKQGSMVQQLTTKQSYSSSTNLLFALQLAVLEGFPDTLRLRYVLHLITLIKQLCPYDYLCP